jgi:hypothetical protein
MSMPLIRRILLLLLMTGFLKGQDTLFPERQQTAVNARDFFKSLNLTAPELRGLQPLIEAGNYYSAYLNLTAVLVRNPYFSEWGAPGDQRRLTLVQRFLKARTTLKTPDLDDWLTANRFTAPMLLELLIHRLISQYDRNELDGPDAMWYWNLIPTLVSLKKREKSCDNAVVMLVASHLTFFRDSPKWRRRGRRIIGKSDCRTLSPEVQAILARETADQ